MLRASEARKEARESLTGKWKTAILISLIYTLIVLAINVLSAVTLGIFSIVLFVITPPLSYGLAHSYYHLKNGDNVGVADFLNVGLKNFGYSWKLTWNIIKKCWVYILIIVIAVVVIIGISVAIFAGATTSILSTTSQSYLTQYDKTANYSDYYDDFDYESYYERIEDLYGDYSDSYNTNLDKGFSQNQTSALIGAIAGASVAALGIMFVVLVLYIVFIVFLIRKMLLYALTYYVAVKHQGIEAKEAVEESERLMQGNRGRLFCLMLSFIGWSLLIALLSGVLVFVPILSTIVSYAGAIILAPYIAFSTLAFYRDLENDVPPVQTQTIDETKKICQNCGAENMANSTFCTNCGTKLN